MNKSKCIFTCFTWYQIEVRFISPRTEGCTQIFQKKTFIVKVFVFCWTLNARRCHNLWKLLELFGLLWTPPQCPRETPPPPFPQALPLHLTGAFGNPWTLSFRSLRTSNFYTQGHKKTSFSQIYLMDLSYFWAFFETLLGFFFLSL